MTTRTAALVTVFTVTIVTAGFVAPHHPVLHAEGRDADSEIELLRADVRTKKMEMVAERMQFTGNEADAFWPLYRQYEVELAAINDKKIKVILDYVASHDNLDGARAKELARRVFEVDQMTLDLRKKYFQEMTGVLSPKTVVRFLQLERRLQQLVDVQLASDFPLIKK